MFPLGDRVKSASLYLHELWALADVTIFNDWANAINLSDFVKLTVVLDSNADALWVHHTESS